MQNINKSNILLNFLKVSQSGGSSFFEVSGISKRKIHDMGMDLKSVVSSLEKIAPSSLAGKWDNVGLLVEPSGNKVIKKLFLANDLTEEVMEEALKQKSDMILSYHPPIFRPLKRITSSSWKVTII